MKEGQGKADAWAAESRTAVPRISLWWYHSDNKTFANAPKALAKKRTAFLVGRIADVDRAQGMKTCDNERTKRQSGRRGDRGPL